MEKTRVTRRQTSSWAVVLTSVFIALLLAISIVQGLSAQTAIDEVAPTATPTGTVEGESEASETVEASASLTATLETTGGEVLTGTVLLTETVALTPTEVVASVSSPTQTIFMPIMATSLVKLTIDATRPNSNNAWQVQWPDFGAGYTYRFQESKRPDFASLIVDETLASAAKNITHSASPFNSYYYRVALQKDGKMGPWSDTLTVVGAYRDDFNDDSTGWAMRRTTFLEETVAWYGQGDNAGNFIIVVADRWDWMIASPLQKAPEPPYVIEYRSRVHDASNLVSGGAVVGGDWNYQACPEFGNVYKTDNCFNHFYNFNYIYYGPMKLQFEQVSTLYWCPTCNGSPIKRLGDPDLWKVVDNVVSHNQGLQYHTYKIEVRDTGLKLWIDNSYKGAFGNGAYSDDPFFGVFASTDEYKPSIWFFDWYKVTPLNS